MRSFSRIVCVVAGVIGCAVGAQAQPPIVVNPGQDMWKVGEPSFLEFGADGGLGPIPPGFFGPGSEPFEGRVYFTGEPIPSLPGVDTVIQRMGSANLPTIGSQAFVPIEIVAMNLVSVQPIVVRTGDGSERAWDVRVSFSVAPGPDGQCHITRDQVTGGAMHYPSLMLMPQVTFVPLDEGPELLLPLPAMFTLGLNGIDDCRWTQTPAAPPLPGQGPNFFPRGDLTLAGAGVRLNLLSVPQITDCDGNGQDDTIDLLDGLAFDANENGRLDECERFVEAVQYSWPDGEGGFIERFSPHGALMITTIEPPAGQAAWANVLVNGQWVIRNLPLHQIDGEGRVHRYLVHFDLANLPGVQVPSIPVQMRIDTVPQEFPPGPTLETTTIPVFEVSKSPGLIENAGAGPIEPGPAANFLNPFLPFLWEIVSRSGVPGVNEAKNHCAPGAGARSMAWMNSHYCLGFGAMCDTAQEIYEILGNDATHMMTTEAAGTASAAKMTQGINDLIMEKMLQDSLMASYVADSDPKKITEALQAGKDVMGIILWRKADGTPNGGHAVTITGAIQCGDNVVIGYRDDAHGTDAQGDGKPDADGTKGGSITPVPGGGHTLGGHGRNSWLGFVQICPTRLAQLKAAMKNASGAAGGGGVPPTEGLQDLIDRILDGHIPNKNEKKQLTDWACRLLDIACALRVQIVECGTPEMLEKADAIKADAMAVKASVKAYLLSGDLSDLAAAEQALNADWDAQIACLTMLLDCNNNGIDDKQDIANGTLHDANNDMVPDECQCLADWDGNGVVEVPDIFAFLADWFAGQGDFDHDGMSGVPDIFAFLAAWFANCP